MLVGPMYSSIVHMSLMRVHTTIQEQQRESLLEIKKGMCRERGLTPLVSSTLFLECFERTKIHDAVVIEFWPSYFSFKLTFY